MSCKMATSNKYLALTIVKHKPMWLLCINSFISPTFPLDIYHFKTVLHQRKMAHRNGIHIPCKITQFKVNLVQISLNQKRTTFEKGNVKLCGSNISC